MTPSLEQPARPRDTDASSQYQEQTDLIYALLDSLEVMDGENGSSPSAYTMHCSTCRSGCTGRASRGCELCVKTLVSASGMSTPAVLKERRRNDIEPYSPSASTSLQTTDSGYLPYFCYP